MKELLEKLQKFKIISPLGTREIKLQQDFADKEFDDWFITGSNNENLILSKNGKVMVKLKYQNNFLAGMDIRGGQTQIHPLSCDKTKFRDYFTAPRKNVLTRRSNKNILNIEKNSDLAVISKTPLDGYDTYWEDFPMYEMYNQLFKAGYTEIINLNCETNPQFMSLLLNLSGNLGMKNGKEISSVQLISSGSGEANEIQYETGDFKGFIINYETWAKIGSIVGKSKLNFYSALKEVFKTYNLKRLSTCMSRDKNSTTQDSRRVNFVMKEQNAKKK